MNSTSSLVVSYESMEIIKLEPDYYKPGLPINFKV